MSASASVAPALPISLLESSPAPPSSTLQDDSENIPATQNSTPATLVISTASDDTPSRTGEPTMIALTFEPSSGPQDPAATSSNRTDSQNSRNVPSTSGYFSDDLSEEDYESTGEKDNLEVSCCGYILFVLLPCVPRSLCFEDWKRANPDIDEGKFTNYWRKLSADKKQVHHLPPSSTLI